VNRNTPLLLLIAFLVLAAIIAIIIIVVRAPNTADQLTLIGAIVAFMAPLIASVMALLRAEQADGTAKAVRSDLMQHLNGTDAAPKTPTSGQ